MTPDQSTQEEPTGESGTADEAVARLEDVQRVTESALAYLNLEDLLNELLDRVKEILQVDTAAVLLVEDDGRTLAARAAKGLEEEVERGFRLPIGRGFAGRVAATRQPVMIEDLESSPVEVVNPLLHEKGIRSLLGIPLVVEGGLIGVLHVGSLAPREFRASDVDLLQLVGDRVALAIERARLAVQDRVAHTLQRSLLPGALPRLPGLRMAARYLPAAHESAVGGDWYDVIELGHRRLGLAIGDVAGHGMAAATYMGQLRHGLRAYALDVEDPGEVLTRLARFANREHSKMATIVYATLNLDTCVVSLARAGHPYPLLTRPDGTASFLTEAEGPPLGTGAEATYEAHRTTIEPGETLFLYTDGLIERRGEQLAHGEAALLKAASDSPEDPELKCRAILHELTEGTPIADDIAMLVVQSVGLERELEVDVPAVAEQLAGIRHLLRRWIAANGGTDDDCSAFAIAATEACANAVEHAYGPTDERIQIRAVLEADVATVAVSDRGTWRESRGEHRGRGMPLMEEFMDEVRLRRGSDGTTVELRRRIGSRPR
jgi:anti-sigma regulatory factor (Ser/Thr protein kinase)/putative methionine-R-sulfoxide reductase with GAF domain